MERSIVMSFFDELGCLMKTAGLGGALANVGDEAVKLWGGAMKRAPKTTLGLTVAAPILGTIQGKKEVQKYRLGRQVYKAQRRR